MRLSFDIDRLTNSIEDSVTGRSMETIVVPISELDVKVILKKNGWRFKWKEELNYAGRGIYKLLIVGDQLIQGLISMEKKENFIELHLIETAPHNYGKSKKYIGVPGNLVAFACKLSFEYGFEGFVAFRAKTQLIEHYKVTLGAELIFKDRMCIAGISSKKLVNSYYKSFLGD